MYIIIKTSPTRVSIDACNLWLIIERQITGVCAHHLKINCDLFFYFYMKWKCILFGEEEIWSTLNRQEEFRQAQEREREKVYFAWQVPWENEHFFYRSYVCRQSIFLFLSIVLFGFINIRYAFVQRVKATMIDLNELCLTIKYTGECERHIWLVQWIKHKNETNFHEERIIIDIIDRKS